MAEKRELTPEENKKANMLSGISLGCMVLPFILGAIPTALFAMMPDAATEGAIVSVVLTLFSAVRGAGFIAAIVLVIIVRVKYPANVFGKVLMWIYIVFGVIFLILMAIVIIACSAACASAFESCKGLG